MTKKKKNKKKKKKEKKKKKLNPKYETVLCFTRTVRRPYS